MSAVWLVQVGQAVVGLQRALPGARVVYCSATGASEPRNLGYMERLGLWGPGNPSFSSFQVSSLRACPRLCIQHGSWRMPGLFTHADCTELQGLASFLV